MKFHNQTIIIAEAGVNHNGSLDLALQLIDAAAESGADIVKFQTFTAEQLATPEVEMAPYQKENCAATESQYNMLKKLELARDYYPSLLDQCKKRKIKFMSSVFDHNDVKFLASLSMPFFKIPSGEITNGPLLLEVAKTQTPIILSTGMATLGEIEQALMVIAFGYLHPKSEPTLEAFQMNWQQGNAHKIISDNVVLLHCTSDYPASLEDVNLKAMNTLSDAFNVSVGYSDHTSGNTTAIAAVARGAKIIEKHFTLDRILPGPDHKASLTPLELKELVDKIREVEKALGSSVKHRTAAEERIVQLIRKSLVASKNIEVGDTFSNSNIKFMRAGGGISPMLYWDKLGKKSKTQYLRNQKIG